MKNCIDRRLKWLLLTLALAIAAEALLLWIAGTFGEATGEMSLNRPSSLWLTWHLPGIALSLLAFGHGPVAGPAAAVIVFAIGILQFFVLFWLMIGLTACVKMVVHRVTSKTGPPRPGGLHNHDGFRRMAVRYWERRRIIYNLALVPAAFLGYAFADTLNWAGDAHPAHYGFVVFWLAMSAFGANICYSFAYALEFLFGSDRPTSRWLRFGRTSAFVGGVLFAMVLALIGGRNIADMEYLGGS
jgi:hypothetical protein